MMIIFLVSVFLTKPILVYFLIYRFVYNYCIFLLYLKAAFHPYVNNVCFVVNLVLSLDVPLYSLYLINNFSDCQVQRYAPDYFNDNKNHNKMEANKGLKIIES